MICPICNKKVQIEPLTEMPCECCKSIIYLDENLIAKIIESKVRFSKDKFIYGIFVLLSAISYLISIIVYKELNNFIAVIFSSITISSIGIDFKYYKFDEYKSVFNLFNALKRGKLQYYDFGSRFYVYTVLSAISLGFCLFIFGLIN